MKNLHKVLSFAAAFIAIAPFKASAQNSQQYSGNGAGGFGGPLGDSTLTVSDNASTGTINFSLALGNGNTSFNDIAFYIANGSPGVVDTSTLNDTQDEGRRALSGDASPGASNGRSLVTFGGGFNPAFGVALDGNGNANLFQLTPGNSLTYTPGASFQGTTNTGVYSFNVTEASLGLMPGQSIEFVATLLNANDSGNGGIYRSNETIGASNVNNSSPNLGQGTLAFSSFDTFTTAVPEPASWLAGGLLVIGAGVTVARSRRSVA